MIAMSQWLKFKEQMQAGLNEAQITMLAQIRGEFAEVAGLYSI